MAITKYYNQELKTILSMDCHLVVVRKLEHLSNPKSYADRSVSSWQGHPSWTGQRVEVGLSAVY